MSPMPTREKLKEVRSKISKKSKRVESISQNDIDLIPLESFWQEFQGLEIKNLDVDCNEATVATIKAKKGTILDIHYHLREEILYIISGEIREIMSDQVISRGNSISFAKKQKHGIEFLEDTTLLVQWVN